MLSALGSQLERHATYDRQDGIVVDIANLGHLNGSGEPRCLKLSIRTLSVDIKRSADNWPTFPREQSAMDTKSSPLVNMLLPARDRSSSE
eukprot:767474-Hanusia_phi.AAC.9